MLGEGRRVRGVVGHFALDDVALSASVLVAGLLAVVVVVRAVVLALVLVGVVLAVVEASSHVRRLGLVEAEVLHAVRGRAGAAHTEGMALLLVLLVLAHALSLLLVRVEPLVGLRHEVGLEVLLLLRLRVLGLQNRHVELQLLVVRLRQRRWEQVGGERVGLRAQGGGQRRPGGLRTGLWVVGRLGRVLGLLKGWGRCVVGARGGRGHLDLRLKLILGLHGDVGEVELLPRLEDVAVPAEVLPENMLDLRARVEQTVLPGDLLEDGKGLLGLGVERLGGLLRLLVLLNERLGGFSGGIHLALALDTLLDLASGGSGRQAARKIEVVRTGDFT